MWADFWNWLANLPQSSASFVGTVTGSALGLFALLLGALFNAHLNRRRDDRLREQEKRGIVTALTAELRGLQRTLAENADRLEKGPPNGGESFLTPDLAHSVQIFPEILPKL